MQLPLGSLRHRLPGLDSASDDVPIPALHG
jgi:hypothetical protein